MGQFKVTTPDGRQYKVTVPEGGTQQDAINYVKNNYKAPVAAINCDAFRHSILLNS